MKYIVEESLYDFSAWSGGKDTLEVLQDKGDCDAVESLIEEMMSCQDEPWDDGAINDFLWFERDTIAQHLGYSDWDEYEYGNEDEEDEEDDEED